jgi:hypothetical protein
LEDRITPAPTGAGTFNSPGAFFTPSSSPQAQPPSGQTFTNGTSPTANTGTPSAAGSSLDTLFPPPIVNALDQSLLESQLASSVGIPAGLPFFTFFQTQILQNPSLSNVLSQEGFSTFLILPVLLPRTGFSPFGNLTPSLQAFPVSILILPTRQNILPLTLFPDVLRIPWAAQMPNSGTNMPGLNGITNQFPNGTVLPGTPLSGPLRLPAFPSGTNAEAAISGMVFRDQNGNGKLDNTEHGIAGLKVVLEARKGKALQTISTTYTDQRGHYVFPSLTAGDYQVRVEVPNGWRLSTEQAQPINLRASAKQTNINFGLTPPRRKPAAPPPNQQSLLDHAFENWTGRDYLALAAETKPAFIVCDSPMREAKEESFSTDAVMLAGAVAIWAEFDLFPRAGRKERDDPREK